MIIPEGKREEISFLMTGDIDLETEEDGKEVVDDMSSYDFTFDKSFTLCNFLGGFSVSSTMFVSGLIVVVFLTFFLLRFFLSNRFFCEKFVHINIQGNWKSKKGDLLNYIKVFIIWTD